MQARFTLLIVTICLHLGEVLSKELAISVLYKVLCIIDLSFSCSEAIYSELLENCCVKFNTQKAVEIFFFFLRHLHEITLIVCLLKIGFYLHGMLQNIFAQVVLQMNMINSYFTDLGHYNFFFFKNLVTTSSLVLWILKVSASEELCPVGHLEESLIKHPVLRKKKKGLVAIKLSDCKEINIILQLWFIQGKCPQCNSASFKNVFSINGLLAQKSSWKCCCTQTGEITSPHSGTICFKGGP